MRFDTKMSRMGDRQESQPRTAEESVHKCKIGSILMWERRERENLVILVPIVVAINSSLGIVSKVGFFEGLTLVLAKINATSEEGKSGWKVRK